MDWLAVSVRFFTGIYVSRAPFSLERMSFNEGSHTVLYRGEHFHPTLTRNFEVTNPLAWIVRITSHIPRKGSKQVIYYGAYSQAWRGRERRQGILPNAKIDKERGSMGRPNATSTATGDGLRTVCRLYPLEGRRS